MIRTTTLFTKRPLPGLAKTRLSPSLDPEQAAELALAMLLDRAEILGQTPELAPQLAYARGQDADWFSEHLPWIPKQDVQVGVGLGQRLAHHFESTLGTTQPASAVVLGSDQPLVPMDRYEQAHKLLSEGVDLVLGPDQSGGYYLVGLTQSRPELFLEVAMSEEGMCQATVAAAEEQGLLVVLLEPDLDLDTGQDLELLSRAISNQREQAHRLAPRTCAAMDNLGAAIPSASAKKI